MNQNSNDTSFPYADLAIPCPEKSNRLTAFFRILCVIPMFILLCLVNGFCVGKGTVIGGGMLFLPIMLTIIFSKKYPKAWFDWVYYLTKFETRIFSYLFLLRDEFPSVDEDQSVKLDLRYPDTATELHRALPLVKWLLAIPHYIILIVLSIAVIIASIIAWFSILLTGKYPSSIHQFVVGFFRWSLRVQAYAFLLLTDQYPPFKF